MLVGFNYNNNEYFYVRDILGNIINIIDSNGNTQSTYKYDAYGNRISIVEESIIEGINSFFYKGYYYDEETCLYYCNSRYYDPNICRWISIDEISYLDRDDINGINLWCYCGNNPVMGYDPDGSWDWKRFFGIAAEILVDALAIAVGISVAAQTGSFELGILSYSIVQNVVNSVYYDCIFEGKTELNESSYNIDDKEFRYLTRWERLDYTKNKTQSSTYGINELRYFGEYSTHMWAWGISKWALD